MTQQLSSKLIKAGVLTSLTLAISLANQAFAQNPADAESQETTTVSYPAAYFNDYSPVSANDMVTVIPGVNLAMGGGGGGNRRGLGSGENEILINGQRVTGKSMSGRDQLSRIPADQVDHIEIIRGASEDLGVRNSGQTLNVVLKDAQSRRSVNTEVNMDRYHDGTLYPGGKLSVTGQTGDLSYVVSAEAEPRYENRFTDEVSYSPDGSLLETRDEERIQERTDLNLNSAFSYQFDEDLVQLNASYGVRNPPTDTERYITDYSGAAPVTRLEREHRSFDRYEWELGGDWEHGFDNGSRYRLLFVVNDRQGEGVRERFRIDGDQEAEKNLYLYNLGRDRERIARNSYIFNPAPDHGLEVGVEAAQTLRNNGLLLGTAGTGTPSDSVGGLVPVPVNNAFSEIEEMRYETFAIHNWQINDRMTLESTLVLEQSEITQTGDVANQRDFQFVRPKVDYRFNITDMIQLRASIEKEVSQLSFSDFSATTDNSDEDKNTEAGNPDIRQEQSWVYRMGLEYRLPDNIGVLSSNVFYRDIEDVIDRIDVTTDPDNPISARGNIGDAERWGIRLDASTRLGFVGLDDALVTANLNLQDSRVTDPFLGIERRTRDNGRGWGNLGFRHDLTDWNMNYGFNYSNPFNGGSGRKIIDVDDIEIEEREPNLSLFVEKRAFGGTTFRLEAQNALDSVFCRDRIRYLGRTADGIVEEIENSCNGDGRKFALKVRRTF
ncbi:MAG: TonB-dependent receptor plug domain-containing protein [Gammaproteobacteria bacterium]|nr:TonB-dependent receptor plug domain-containing protein [Pseudomonadales bacterium]MCP5346493.1 TonB-dependent receptor plug domain-containing protein [Pseudomonadales bacterium]